MLRAYAALLLGDQGLVGGSVVRGEQTEGAQRLLPQHVGARGVVGGQRVRVCKPAVQQRLHGVAAVHEGRPQLVARPVRGGAGRHAPRGGEGADWPRGAGCGDQHGLQEGARQRGKLVPEHGPLTVGVAGVVQRPDHGAQARAPTLLAQGRVPPGRLLLRLAPALRLGGLHRRSVRGGAGAHNLLLPQPVEHAGYVGLHARSGARPRRRLGRRVLLSHLALPTGQVRGEALADGEGDAGDLGLALLLRLAVAAAVLLQHFGEGLGEQRGE